MNIKFANRLLIGLLSLWVFSTTVAADEISYDAKLVTVKGVSGYSGSVTKRQPAGGGFLYGITADEKDNAPCYVKFHWWRTTGPSKTENLTTTFKTPECTSSQTGDKSVIFGNAASSKTAVSSLSVCNNKKSNHRLKGIELTSRKLTGTSLNPGTVKEFARTNCASWDSASSCPTGQWAVGVDVHTQNNSITGLALRCAAPEVEGAQVVEAGLQLKPATKSPNPGNKKAALIVHYFGDSKFESLFQEGQINLSKFMDAYDRNVLLSHSNLPDWMSGHDKARDMADVVAAPTKENFAFHLEDLADRGYVTDIVVLSHGWRNGFRMSNGSFGDNTKLTDTDLRNMAKTGESYTGYKQLPIRAVFQMNCYGKELNDEWEAIGAKVVGGTPKVNFLVNSLNTYIRRWTAGDTFNTAIDKMDKKSAWTVMDTLILADALSSRKEWGGCPFGKTVLGSHSCAKDYFGKQWDDTGWNAAGANGKDYMRYSSRYFKKGTASLTINSRPTW